MSSLSLTPLFDETTAGALLIDKPAGISSFGVIESLQRALREKTGLKKSALPKFGHGGTLDPFATGLLVVCVGRGVKLAQYFLGSDKTYTALVRFGATSVSGDCTNPITEESAILPQSLEAIQTQATLLAANPYHQTPPMHSAIKVGGQPLYELARQGKEIERPTRECTLSEFKVITYNPPRAQISVRCTAGTYIRVLAQDLGRSLGTVALLDELRRIASGNFRLEQAIPLAHITDAIASGQPLSSMPNWIGFDDLLAQYPRAEANAVEADAILHGRKGVIPGLMERAFSLRLHTSQVPAFVPTYLGSRLIAIVRRNESAESWELEKVFS